MRAQRFLKSACQGALFGLLALSAQACAPWRPFTNSSELFEPLSRGDMSGFEQRLAHLTRLGAEGEALTLATQWLYLLSCQPIPQLPAPQRPLWRALYASLYLEESREPSELGHLQDLTQAQPTQLNLTPPTLNPNLWTQWPKDQEGWPDEAPVHVQVPRACRGALGRSRFDPQSVARLAPKPNEPQVVSFFQDKPRQSAAWLDVINHLSAWLLPQSEAERATLWRELAHLGWSQRALSALELALKQGEGEQRVSERPLDTSPQAQAQAQASQAHADTPTKSPLLSSWRWWLTYNEALLLSRRSQVELGWPLRASEEPHSLWLWAQRATYQASCERWRWLSETTAPTQGLASELKLAPTQASLMWGLCLESQGELERALKVWERLPLSELESRAQELIRYHQVRLLSDLGRWSEVLPYRAYLPPERSPLYAAFCFALGRAHHNAGDEAGLMALSTEVFRERSWRRDPMLRGLFYLFVRALTRFDFEGRVIELLEDLGPRSETFERVRLFAEVALDEAQPQQAREAAMWLLSRRTRAQDRYQEQALLAHAALLALDEQSFSRALRAISGVEEGSQEAILKGRRGAFYEARDRALTRLLQRLLPTIAEWSQGRERRRWLELTLSEVQRFLRSRPESRARLELNELYRAGRAALDPRAQLAYAERVGRAQPQALILGRVRVQALNLDPFEPRDVELSLRAPWSLTLIPGAALAPERWSLTWRIQTAQDINEMSAPPTKERGERER